MTMGLCDYSKLPMVQGTLIPKVCNIVAFWALQGFGSVFWRQGTEVSFQTLSGACTPERLLVPVPPNRNWKPSYHIY